MTDQGNITTPNAADLNTAARKYAASQGWAMPDGSYPIRPANLHGATDLDKAVGAVGRGGASHDAIRRHIIKRAKAIGKSNFIPDNWTADGHARSAPMTILNRTYETELHVRDDDRVIAGTVVPYGVPAQVTEYGKTYTETFARGAFAADLARASDVELTALHPRSGEVLPIGVTMALVDTPAGLDGEWRISETEFGNDVLTLVRDRAVRALSAGFAELTNRWHSRDAVTRVTATLDHVALVRRGAYPGARLRAAQGRHDPLQLIARLRQT